ncbi:peroxisomal membrane protein-like protein Pmp47 [Microthyrium microscopicum]|uniref:Peroxisomal membrane protein-like protein Pmp47 n=1 Tax=Microthyrium microscopicum TaxID=703497 RepID=A0A6A6U503_9PEZI|nr:peroxisomal membrane protein-like protein Pmp47 [Microthyrium microscopicum]
MPVQSKEMALPPWGGAVAGATGAVMANALVYPLDLIKTKLQVQTKKGAILPEGSVHYDGTWDAIVRITQTEGLAGLYAGMPGCLMGVASTNFAYFYWYTLVRGLFISRYPGQPGTAAELSLGAVAGALAQLFTIPVAVVTTRQQTADKADRKSLMATAQEVINGEDGWTGLWRGLKASLVLVINPSITYGAYQRLRVQLFPNKKNLSAGEAFLLGAISKSIATVVTQPLIVAKVGLQSKPPPERNGRPFKTFGEVLKHIVDNEGIMRLFKGIGPQILKGLLVQGLLMMTKERIELAFILLFRYIRQVRSEQLAKLSASASAALAKASPVIVK